MKKLLLIVLVTFLALNGRSESINYSVDNIFYECDSETKEARVTSANGATGKVQIPKEIDVYGTLYAVKAIGENIGNGGLMVFQGSSVTELIISEGIQEICKNALTCSTLEAVTLPNSLSTIDDYAFNGCVALKDIVIPEGVNTIGENAFLGCSSLKSASIPQSATQIGKGTFAYCNELNQIIVAPGNTVYDSRDNCNAIIVTATNELVQGCPGTVIHSTVTRIGESAFAGFAFSQFEIPDHITALGAYAFEGCSNLTSISIPEGVTELEKGTFQGCTSLQTIDIPSSVTTIGDFCFQVTGLTSLTLPSSVTSFGQYIVALCSNLKSVHVSYNPPFDISNKTFMTYDNKTWQDAGCIDATLYVPKDTKVLYEATGGWKEFKTIMEFSTTIPPIDTETEISISGLDGQSLTNSVVDDVYYNVGSEGYDSTDGSIVIGETTDMSQITDDTPGSDDIVNNFTGLILKVAAGKGTIKVNVKTTGNAQLVVQVGNQTPVTVTKSEQGDVVVSYDVAEDTYVYIYAIIGTNAAPAKLAAGTDAVRIYSITVSPGATGMAAVLRPQSIADGYYTLDGRQLQGTPTQKGVYIRNGRNVVIR